MIGTKSTSALPAAALAAAVAGAAVVLTWVGMHHALAVAALLYAAAYCGVAYRWPAVGLLLVFATAPFQNDLSGGGGLKFSASEIHLFLFTPVYLWRAWSRHRQILPMGPMAVPLLLWFGVSACSALLHPRGAPAVVSIIQMVLYQVVAFTIFGFGVDDRRQLRLPLYGLVVVGVFLACATLTQPPGGEVFHLSKNGVGASLGCALVVCCELWLSERPGRRRSGLLAAMAVLTAGMVFTLSRGAWLGAAAGLTIVLLLRQQVVLFLRLLVVIVLLSAVCWSYLPKEKQAYVTGFESKRWNIHLRYLSAEYAESFIRQQPWIGMGVGLRKEYDATNIVLLTLAETGAVGLGLFLLLHGLFLHAVWKARTAVPRTDPRFTLLAVGAALVPSHLAHGMVDHYWGRGELGLAWSAAGMAWGVVMAVRTATTVRRPVTAAVPRPAGAVPVVVTAVRPVPRPVAAPAVPPSPPPVIRITPAVRPGTAPARAPLAVGSPR